MSATDQLISAMRAYGLYPFVYSTKYAAPGAIVDHQPQYIVQGSIFDEVYGFNGNNPFKGLEAGATDVAPEYEAEIADLFSKQSISSTNELSVAYGGTKLGAALDLVFESQVVATVRPVGLTEQRFPSMTPDALAATFTEVQAASLSTALGQLVDRMKQRWVTPNRPRPLDIAQLVLVAQKLELSFVTDIKWGAKLQLQLQTAATASSGALTIGASSTGTNYTEVKATWASERPLPVLWYPWRYGWDMIRKRFATVSI